MSLFLVRHGQASAGSDDYDRLSELGREQSRRLGRWLAAGGYAFDRVVVGGMRRHRETLESITEGYGAPLPEAHLDAGFAEFDHHAVFETFARTHSGHPAVMAVQRDGLPAFGGMIRAALEAWAHERIVASTETWSGFGARVRAAGDRLAEHDGHALVVTSGGVIARLAQGALDAGVPETIDLNLSLRNSGLCRFAPRVGGDAPAGSRLELASWNGLDHLDDERGMWTYY
ncbi:MAG: histidine phosphatase family protein [Arenimonas sp.]